MQSPAEAWLTQWKRNQNVLAVLSTSSRQAKSCVIFSFNHEVCLYVCSLNVDAVDFINLPASSFLSLLAWLSLLLFHIWSLTWCNGKSLHARTELLQTHAERPLCLRDRKTVSKTEHAVCGVDKPRRLGIEVEESARGWHFYALIL